MAEPLQEDINIGARIRARREERRLTQGQLADAIGVTFQQVQKYERGTNRVSASRLSMIATTLDTPITYMYGITPPSGDSTIMETSSGRSIIAAWDKMTAEQRQAFSTIAQAIAA